MRYDGKHVCQETLQIFGARAKARSDAVHSDQVSVPLPGVDEAFGIGVAQAAVGTARTISVEMTLLRMSKLPMFSRELEMPASH